MPLDHAPLRQAMLDVAGYAERTWARWFQAASSAANVIAHVSKSLQSAAIAAMAITSSTTLPAGMYRVGYYVQITKVGSVSSAVQVTIGWTCNGQAQTKVGANVNGNLLTSFDSGTVEFRMDAGTQPTMAVSYASNLANEAQFLADATLEALPDPVTQ